MSLNKNRENIVIVAHKFLTQPDDDLVLFLNNKKTESVLHIYHSFSDAGDRKSFAIWYKKGKEYQRHETIDFKNYPEPFVYLKEALFTCWSILRTRQYWEVYIGMDGLCVIFGNILRFFGVIERTIFWAIDFVPEKRFDSRIKNSIYSMINSHGYKHADEMWDLSPRMAEAREKFASINKTDYRAHRVVPYGLWLNRLRHYSYEECEKNTLVFMGHLLEKQGVQLVIRALPKLVKKNPNFQFKIIGTGRYKDELLRLADEEGVLKHCDFRGKIDDILELEQEVAKSAVAIAPYIKLLDTWTYYADPGKVKTYLASGVPVLLTDIPWNAKEIEEAACGMIITEDVSSIVEKVMYLMEGSLNQKYRENARRYSKKFDYNEMFKDLI